MDKHRLNYPIDLYIAPENDCIGGTIIKIFSQEGVIDSEEFELFSKAANELDCLSYCTVYLFAKHSFCRRILKERKKISALKLITLEQLRL